MPTRKNYRILSFDGGGVRGLMSAIWVSRLEQKLGKPVREYFDLIAGTSTGAIIACGLSMGMPASKIVQLYLDKSREIFPAPASRLWNRVLRTFNEGISAPRYSAEGLEKVLQQTFGGTRFGDLTVKPTLVTAYDTFNREALVFKNDRDLYNSIPVWSICRASASAPTYFPAHTMQLGNQLIPVIDGGVVANNPTACAIAEAVRINQARPAAERVDLSNVLVASFGTGEVTHPITIEEATEWGPVEWAVPLIDVLFDGSADAVNYIAKYLIADDNYFRFQTPLDKAYDDLDRADAANLNALARIAEDYLAKQGNVIIDRLVDALRVSASV